MAKRLVMQSRTAGDRVAVYVSPEVSRVGRLITRVLQEVGYRATFHDTNYWLYRNNHTKSLRINLGYEGWAPDFFAASQFYVPLLFHCRIGALAQLGVCNAAIDKVADRALRLQTTNPASAVRLWQRVYRRVDADARIVPTDGGSWGPVIVSRRTENYIPEAVNADFPLLDQLWVK